MLQSSRRSLAESAVLLALHHERYLKALKLAYHKAKNDINLVVLLILRFLLKF